ncbi:Zinc finger CCCH domain-containing protein 12 [Acorus gramineus]|uniref:Zinc finger CCCH domain-containing protein 12 n=1 Tax=Acorus gramineus TaxID=55184 RepID=A0AAV9AUZ2_ACOGR|nr:Zinc finger CCCH domain-containing protein 12 [Acorus gramineus]
MWRLSVQAPDDGGNRREGLAQSGPYPDRPGEPDCIYYLRTGLCGYGSNCRFNHPNVNGQLARYSGELPERTGQPDCQYFLKTGTCKFGVTCKYHHPRDRNGVGQVSLNVLGLPMREEEKSCQYYMRTGSCKFGMACKFNHPQPATFGAVLPVTGYSAYGSSGSSVAPPSGISIMGGLSAWSLPRAPYLSAPRMQSHPGYMPVVLPSSQGMIPAQPGWSTYMSTVSPVSSTDVIRSNSFSNAKQSVQSGINAQMQALSASMHHHLPDRPDQPDCQYFMKNGSCKFGPSCKYHHPKERITSLSTNALGAYGLPRRPGQSICTYYTTYGSCKYGPNCKFDHPMLGYYNYGLTPLPIPDPASLYPYQRNSPVITTLETQTPPSKASRLPDRPEKKGNVENGPKEELQAAPSTDSLQDQSA